MIDLARGGDTVGLELPIPEDDAIASSSRLVAAIAARIEAQGGAIRFDEYMQMALYEPGLGYYSGGAVKFGAAGDYVTAPEISPLFGFCLAQQISGLIGQGCGASILEFGAGSGKLCADLSAALPGLEHYLILELSAELKHRQEIYLSSRLNKRQLAKIRWLNALPKAFDGIVLANEVVDAMPVHLLVKQGGWQELGVGYRGEGFSWQIMRPAEPLLKAIQAIDSRLGSLPENYRCALSMLYRPWFSALGQACAKAVVLIIDYGYEQQQYYNVDRGRSAIDCYYRHRLHFDPLVYPGLQDMTAYVDFDALADAAEAAGFQPLGLVSQDHFLRYNGLLEEAQRLISESPVDAQLAVSEQVKTLCLPSAMGRRFKVLAVQKNRVLAMPAMRRERDHG